ncbi:hypothetical protein IPdc08_00322 [archaeon]|nr:hypothetical protein IPdc08_00322 [archaeon]
MLYLGKSIRINIYLWFTMAIRLYNMIEIKKIAEKYSYDIHAINY